MRLTVYTDYSLRLLIYAALKPDGLVNISDVASAYGISRSHLTKVVHQLGIAGFLETVRGKGGGLRLARAPSAGPYERRRSCSRRAPNPSRAASRPFRRPPRC